MPTGLISPDRDHRACRKFNANLTMLFNEVPFLDRFRAAKDAGFQGVEYLFPYAHHKQELVELLETNGLTQVLHNLPAGNWAGGERGIACHPDRVAEFQDGVGTAIDYAQALDCKQLNCLVGITPSRSRGGEDPRYAGAQPAVRGGGAQARRDHVADRGL